MLLVYHSAKRSRCPSTSCHDCEHVINHLRSSRDLEGFKFSLGPCRQSRTLAFAFNSLYFLLIWIPKRFKVRLGSQVRLHAVLHTLCLSRLSARLATLQVQSRNFRLLKLEKLHIAELTSEYTYRSPRAQELSWHTQEPTRT